MTPAQHKTAAEAGLSRMTNTNLVGPTAGGFLIYQVHAHLASALGTGTHYDNADQLLATLRPDPDSYTQHVVGSEALLHAILADR